MKTYIISLIVLFIIDLFSRANVITKQIYNEPRNPKYYLIEAFVILAFLCWSFYLLALI